MRIFVVGDLHLSLSPLVNKPMDIFGYDWHNHQEKINHSWNLQVQENDLVIILGDTSWGLKFEEALSDLQYIDALPGNKIILKGNHDLWWKGITRMNTMFDTIKFIQGRAIQYEDVVVCGTRGWINPGSDNYNQNDEKIFKREVLRLKNAIDEANKLVELSKVEVTEVIGCLHYPPTNEKFQESEITKAFSNSPIKKVFYGHLHGKDGFKRGIQGNFNGVEYRLASVDYLGFKLLRVR